jgi:hypothetical protein
MPPRNPPSPKPSRKRLHDPPCGANPTRTRKRSSGGVKKSSCKTDKECGKDKLCRKDYIKKNGIKVKRTCIKDIGGKGRGKKLFVIKDTGLLSSFGYSLKDSKELRHKAIDKAIEAKDALGVQRHLVAIRTLSKHYKNNYAKYDNDVKYIQKTHFAQAGKKKVTKKKVTKKKVTKKKVTKKKVTKKKVTKKKVTKKKVTKKR